MMDVMRAVLSLSMALTLFGCGSDPGGGDGPSNQNPCTTTPPDAKCGASCADDNACGENLYCLGGACTADCAPDGSGCGAGYQCVHGRCLPHFGDAGGNPYSGDGACAVTSSQATLGKKPVDIIFVVDNSGSMSDEIIGIQDNINVNFAQIIGASGLDYRVIMVSRHGEAVGPESICISPPLSGNATCNPPPAQPTNGARFFHYSTEIDSHNSLRKIRDTYNTPDEFNQPAGGWSTWLRADALKVFVEVTDDEARSMTGGQNDPTTDPIGTANAFETALFGLTPKMFGDANNRNYVFHSIVGLAENNPATKAWEPNDPVQTTKCRYADNSESEHHAPTYQELSKRTGGLRFPVCEFGSYDSVFQTIAQGVVAGAQIACDFAIPDPPTGETLDLSRVAVAYTPGSGGSTQYFSQAMNSAACVPNAFYIENNRIYLCPDACTTVKADSSGKVDVLFTCGSTIL